MERIAILTANIHSCQIVTKISRDCERVKFKLSEGKVP